jgi:hypothetical protein
MSAAVYQWERQVSASHGAPFALWYMARNTKFECSKQRGSDNWRCRAVGSPCDASAPQSLPASADPNDRPRDVVLEVKLIGQRTEQWCWAASAEMTVGFLGKAIAQCQQANVLFNRTDCCHDLISPACVRPGNPEYDKWGFASRVTKPPLPFAKIKEEIGAGRPINWARNWKAGGGHMVVVTGYREIGTSRWIAVHDPLPVGKGHSKWVPYDEYVQSDTYTHQKDFYEIIHRTNAATNN